MNQKQSFFIQSQTVKTCAKHLIKEIKKHKKILEREKTERFELGYFEDCGEFYQQQVEERETTIRILVRQKISLEKYAKKLRHMAEES